VPVPYLESYLPTRRHRKLRWRDQTATFNVTVPEVMQSEAPIALIQRGWLPDGFSKRFGGGERLQYRWWRKRLWVQPRMRHYTAHPEPNRYATLQDAIEHRRFPYSRPESKREAGRLARAWARDLLLVEGRLHVPLGEPLFELNTFGLGHNHGGTSVSVVNHYNSNLHRDRYFRVDQAEAAIQAATRVAQARGDTNNLPFKLDTTVEVVLPEVLRRNPRRDHGTGDAFLNSMYAISESGAPPAVVGLAGLALALKR